MSAMGRELETPAGRALMFSAARLKSSSVESHWSARALRLAEGAARAWSAGDPGRSAAGFFEWASDAGALSEWMRGRWDRPDGDSIGLRAHFLDLPGYGSTGAGEIWRAQHGYMAGRAFGDNPKEWRFVESACDDPELMAELAAAGFEALAWPEGEGRAQEGWSRMEAIWLARSIRGAAIGGGRGVGWL